MSFFFFQKIILWTNNDVIPDSNSNDKSTYTCKISKHSPTEEIWKSHNVIRIKRADKNCFKMNKPQHADLNLGYEFPRSMSLFHLATMCFKSPQIHLPEHGCELVCSNQISCFCCPQSWALLLPNPTLQIRRAASQLRVERESVYFKRNNLFWKWDFADLTHRAQILQD